jgi:hypothetical protein
LVYTLCAWDGIGREEPAAAGNPEGVYVRALLRLSSRGEERGYGRESFGGTQNKHAGEFALDYYRCLPLRLSSFFAHTVLGMALLLQR